MSHPRTLFNVVHKWFNRIIAKISLHRDIAHFESWIKAIYRRADWLVISFYLFANPSFIR
jgi:hypothetical protein